MRVSLCLALASVPLLLPSLLPAQSATPANPALRSLFLVGDLFSATASPGSAASFVTLFDTSKLNVVDRTHPGHSSRNAIASGDWAASLALVKPDDVVLIQFGAHEADLAAAASIPSTESTLPGLNDDFRDTVDPATGKHELVHSFGWYLREMVVETIAHGATPVLCSLASSSALQGPGTYSDWTRAIAIQQRVPFLDLGSAVRQLPAASQSASSSADTASQAIVAALKGLQPDPLAGFFSPAGAAIPATLPPPPPPATAPTSLVLPVPPPT